MNDFRNVGRWVGVGMLTSFVIGMVSNFKLQTDLFAQGGLLVNAAAHTDKIGWIALLGLFTSLVSVFVAVLLASRLRHRSPVMSLFYCAIVIASLAISMVEYSSLFAFSSLSKAYLASGPDAMTMFDAAKAALSGLRNGVHYLDKLLGGAGVLVLFSIFYRLRLLPRVLAGFGIVAALCQMTTVGRALFGHDVVHLMLAPIALAFVATIAWLLAKGFPDDPDDAAMTAPTNLQAGRAD